MQENNTEVVNAVEVTQPNLADAVPIQENPPKPSPISGPLANLFNRLNNRNKNARGAFGGKRKDNHVRTFKKKR
jgi:hypothetical protein